MKVVLCALALAIALSVAAGAAEPAKVSLNVSDATLTTAAEQLAKQSGVSIVVDPKVDAKITVSVSSMELPRALDLITKMSKSTWKKVQFAQPAETKVTLDQIKSSVLALATMPLVAASVQDGSGKGAAMFARELSDTPDTSKISLPEGYSWVTVYAVYMPDQPVVAAKPDTKASNPADQAKVDQLGKQAFDKPAALAELSSEDRQKVFQNEMMGYMSLVPEARRQVLRDQMSAMRNMDPAMRKQLMQDMGRMMGRSRGQQNQNRNNQSKGTVIPSKSR